jgi:Fe2+-dicitrate sensor, membrane component
MNGNKQDIESLTIAFLNEGLNHQDKVRLQQLLKTPENKAYFKKMYAVWCTVNHSVEEESVEKAFQKTMFRIDSHAEKDDRRKIRRLSFSFTKMAAAVFLSFLLGAASYYIISSQQEKTPEVIAAVETTKVMVPLGSKSKVELPDGSLVTLNAGSKLHYHTTFGKETREVWLEGEAYFKVAKNAKIPFVVRAKEVTIKALGTEFNVKAYPEEKMVQTTLVNGLVSVLQAKASSDTQELMMKPKQTVTIYDEGTRTIDEELEPVKEKEKVAIQYADARKPKVELKDEVKTELYTSWKDSRWVIESESIEEVAMKLQRRYDVQIIIANNDLKQYPFTGILTDETLEQVLEIMKSVVPINYVISKKVVLLNINPNQRKIFEESMKKQK